MQGLDAIWEMSAKIIRSVSIVLTVYGFPQSFAQEILPILLPRQTQCRYTVQIVYPGVA